MVLYMDLAVNHFLKEHTNRLSFLAASAFCSRYDEEYADTCGKFRHEKIQTVGEHIITCGDYRQR